MKLLMLKNGLKFRNSTSVNISLVGNSESVKTSHITTKIPDDSYSVVLPNVLPPKLNSPKPRGQCLVLFSFVGWGEIESIWYVGLLYQPRIIDDNVEQSVE
jgi:hypothetical protein